MWSSEGDHTAEPWIRGVCILRPVFKTDEEAQETGSFDCKFCSIFWSIFNIFEVLNPFKTKIYELGDASSKANSGDWVYDGGLKVALPFVVVLQTNLYDENRLRAEIYKGEQEIALHE